MSGTSDYTPENESFHGGLGSLAMTMIAFWLGDPLDSDDLDELPTRIGPGILVLWTVIGVAVAGLLSAFQLGFGDQDHPAGYFALIPMVLPLVVATARLPVRCGRALALGLGLGVAVGLAAGLALGTVVGSYWQVFLGLSAGALLAAAVYGTVARPPSATD